MSDDTEMLIPRAASAPGILILAAAIPPLALALHALAGPLVATLVCGVYAVALVLTVIAERNSDTPSRDPLTGLPDRAAALARLEGIFAQKLAGSSQAAVIVVTVKEPDSGEMSATGARPTLVIVTARLAQGLRRGDQIIRVGEHSLAAILGPSRGLTARAAESILDRVDGMFRDPIRVGSHMIPVRVSLGACLQHDAPRADAASWVEAAELAAEVADEEGEPRLFPSGATKVDRSAWDFVDFAIAPGGAGENLWREVAEGRVDGAALHTQERRRERA